MKFRMVLLTATALTAILALVGCGDDSTTAVAPDTTPPLAPVILGARGSDAAVSVWWDQNSEPDLAGYHVYFLQGSSVVRVTAKPVQNTSFVHNRIIAPVSLVRVTAVDNTGNESAAANHGVKYSGDSIEGVDGRSDKLVDSQF